MNKQEYLHELEKALRVKHVPDNESILEEYAEHFDMKKLDGYSEEEISAKLGFPKDLAEQFASINTSSGTEKWKRVALSIGLVFVHFFVGAFFILLYTWVFALLATSIASAALGISIIARISLWGIIPQMPYFCALFIGLTLLAMAVLSIIGMEYCRLYTTQLLRVYIHWCKSILRKRKISPPLTIYPQIEAKKRRRMRTIALISLTVLAICALIGVGSMMISAGTFEPWHAWHWFESV